MTAATFFNSLTFWHLALGAAVYCAGWLARHKGLHGLPGAPLPAKQPAAAPVATMMAHPGEIVAVRKDVAPDHPAALALQVALDNKTVREPMLPVIAELMNVPPKS